MNKIPVDIIVIVGLTIFLVAAIQFGWLEKYYMFAFVPLYAMYHLGKYVGIRAGKKIH